MNLNNEHAYAPHAMNAPPEPVQSPPPFLSGVPMVNPGNYTMPSNVEKTPEQFIPQQTFMQQPMSQTQSMVSNMAAYSSSK
jgi:hypothetical protein